MKNSMKVKVLVKFLNPQTNRMTKTGQLLNVPNDGFWFRRISDMDCEKLEVATKLLPKTKPEMKDSKKGSK